MRARSRAQRPAATPGAPASSPHRAWAARPTVTLPALAGNRPAPHGPVPRRASSPPSPPSRGAALRRLPWPASWAPAASPRPWLAPPRLSIWALAQSGADARRPAPPSARAPAYPCAR
nr:basic proline-rich protein-like [Aegilops tauschii subsp. strangulata]